jgi:protein-disulfide isomerase
MPSRPDGDPSPHRKSHRYAVVAAAVLAVIAVAMTVAFVRDHRSQAESLDPRTAALRRSVDALLAGVPQSGNALGSPSAPVTLQFFGDLECSTSRAFVLELLPPVISKWVRTGELRVEYRSLRTATPSSEVFMSQQAAALAAGRQDKLWHYVENFYREQGREGSGYVTEGYLRKLAEQVSGMNLRQWGRDRVEPSLAAEIATDEQVAASRDLNSTPSLLIGRTGSGVGAQPRQYAVEPLALDAAIEALLAKTVRSARIGGDGHGVDVAFRTGGPSSDREHVPC